MLSNLKNPLTDPIRFELRPQVRKLWFLRPPRLHKINLPYKQGYVTPVPAAVVVNTYEFREAEDPRYARYYWRSVLDLTKLLFDEIDWFGNMYGPALPVLWKGKFLLTLMGKSVSYSFSCPLYFLEISNVLWLHVAQAVCQFLQRGQYWGHEWMI